MLQMIFSFWFYYYQYASSEKEKEKEGMNICLYFTVFEKRCQGYTQA